MASVTTDGLLVSPGVQSSLRPLIQKGKLGKVTGIIVHQTDSDSARGTLAAYLSGGNGAHFLIDRDGTIHQTASMHAKTWHVGKLKAKCFETHTCSPAEVKIGPGKPTQINRLEMKKAVPERFPSNEDSIGIELVGRCILDRKFVKPGMSKEIIARLTADKGVFETVTPAQNAALKRLVLDIQEVLVLPADQVFPHARVSAKNVTEAATAQWPGKQ